MKGQLRIVVYLSHEIKDIWERNFLQRTLNKQSFLRVLMERNDLLQLRQSQVFSDGFNVQFAVF